MADLTEEEYKNQLRLALEDVREFTNITSLEKGYRVDIFVMALLLASIRIATQNNCPDEELQKYWQDAIRLIKESDKLKAELTSKYVQNPHDGTKH